MQCSSTQYIASCTPTSNALCTDCDAESKCAGRSPPMFLSGCTGTSSGVCIVCDAARIGCLAKDDNYLANCGNNHPGTCLKCYERHLYQCPEPLTQFLDGCGGLLSGTCTQCSGGKTPNYYSHGCTWKNNGVETPCSCSQPNSYNTGCGGKAPGLCTVCDANTQCESGQELHSCGDPFDNPGTCIDCVCPY
eukprot:3124148-Rhodomonas_salina.1